MGMSKCNWFADMRLFSLFNLEKWLLRPFFFDIYITCQYITATDYLQAIFLPVSRRVFLSKHGTAGILTVKKFIFTKMTRYNCVK